MGTQSHCPVPLPSIAELILSVGSPSVLPLSSSGATSHITKIAQGRLKKRKSSLSRKGYRHPTTISMLPDNVLLEVFDFYRNIPVYTGRPVWSWHLLVHVCRTWRQIVLESPRRLDLQILCTYGTPVRRSLDIWPAFPITLNYNSLWNVFKPIDDDDAIAALEHPDRVCSVVLDVAGSQLEKMVEVMLKPFPALTRLHIHADGNAPVLPAEFLGGSAPFLQNIYLEGIPVPALPKLLLSAGNLVDLSLHNIPPTGYISPQVMVASLAALPRLGTFAITFQSATPRPDRIRPPPVTRTVLPALTSFLFRGASEYLEDLVARIDGPQLDRISIQYLNQLADFQVAQYSNFFDRSVGPKLTQKRHSQVTFSRGRVSYECSNLSPWDWWTTKISCEGLDWQVSHMAQVLSQSPAILSNVVHLELKVRAYQLRGADDVEWLHLLRQFSTVQTLRVSWELAGQVALALKDITGEMVAEVLPSLGLICLVGQPASSIEQFVAARQLSGRPVTIINTEWEFDKRLESYVSEQEKPFLS